ncbi:MAG: peptidyl-prolyl cis-trans isomerase [Gemmataceae bacterium]
MGVLAVVGCQSAPTAGTSLYPPGEVLEGRSTPAVQQQRSASEAAYKARSQAPDDGGLKMPVGKLLVVPGPESTLPSATPTPTSSINPVTYSKNASGQTPPGLSVDPFREKAVQVVAYIGTEAVITDEEVWQMVRQRARDYIQMVGLEREAKEKAVFQEELRKIVERELVIIEMLTRLKKAKKEPVIDELKDHAEKMAGKRLTEYRKLNKFGSEEEFLQALKSQGLTYKGLRRQLERDTISGIFLEQTLKDKPKQITLSDLWDYYQANPKDFAVEDKVVWQDLFISFSRFNSPAEAKKYGDQVWREAKEGADFVGLVKKYGQGDSNLRGGEGIGTKRGEIQPRELESVLLDMKAGEVSALLQTVGGYHLVKVTERDQAGVKEFNQQVQMECRFKLSQQVQKVEYEKLMDELWRKYRPKIVE